MDTINTFNKVPHLDRKKFILFLIIWAPSLSAVLLYFYITRAGGNYYYFQKLLREAMSGNEHAYQLIEGPMVIFLAGELMYFCILFLRQNDLTGKFSWEILGLFIGTIIAQGFWYDLRIPVLLLNGVILFICLVSKGHLSEGANPIPTASFFGKKKDEKEI